ncbi:Uracil-DNA glycosylase, putative family 6 [Labilithrix luteola]|uniref:Type-4 uracil-DNA glycosylase n=1 Tax=Labilithrix luteola TaxID=1391654 RepID=A0A0K1PWH6_9BACT|nr:UdgX family uracil-DNA binding protein [Labilithrix luteola]AKU97721.1 Uracil-DNA glycosylase, putative family 6 [Labilithrix luteola]
MPPRKGSSPSLALVPEDASYEQVALAARDCRACGLYARATQTVFGEGAVPSPLMLVGEQPGDKEDLQGHPFVGPAGRILDEALERADIPREQVYVTNAVKHFKWEPRGKRRMHAKPNMAEVHACHGWLEAEIALVQPAVLVCLGATAAAAIFGSGYKLMENRGHVTTDSPWAQRVIATYHPSALLRMMPDEDAYTQAMAFLVSDLELAASFVSFRTERRRERRPSESLLGRRASHRAG